MMWRIRGNHVTVTSRDKVLTTSGPQQPTDNCDMQRRDQTGWVIPSVRKRGMATTTEELPFVSVTSCFSSRNCWFLNSQTCTMWFLEMHQTQ